MDPVLIIALGAIVVIIGAYVVYKIYQRKRRTEMLASLDKLPEAEKQARLAQIETKNKWGCLSAFAGLALLGNSVVAIIMAISAVSNQNETAVLALVVSVLGAVFAGFIYWRHKRWAVYGYATLLVLSGLLGALANPASLFQSVIPLLLLYAAAKPVWDLLDPPKAGVPAPAPTPAVPPHLPAVDPAPALSSPPDFPELNLAQVQLVPTMNIPESPAAGGPRLEIKTGARAGAVIPVQQDFSIGRAPDNSLSLPDGRMSRQHLRIRYAQGAWFAQDQNSTAGTTVNGQKVAAIRLNSGDEIVLGETVMVFRT